MFSSSLCASAWDSLVSIGTSGSLEAWLCLSWVRMALVCAIDQASQLQSALPSRDQQEEQQQQQHWLCLYTGVALMYLSALW